ncbi:MAG: hypothetical protein NUV63_08820, partial [Gallionella sp.]|nr:hypothetical protein [Gallionella sp.]
GRNPAIKNTPRSGQSRDVVPLTWEFVNHPDTGLTAGQFIPSLSKGRYDTVFLMDYLGSISAIFRCTNANDSRGNAFVL